MNCGCFENRADFIKQEFYAIYNRCFKSETDLRYTLKLPMFAEMAFFNNCGYGLDQHESNNNAEHFAQRMLSLFSSFKSENLNLIIGR